MLVKLHRIVNKRVSFTDSFMLHTKSESLYTIILCILGCQHQYLSVKHLSFKYYQNFNSKFNLLIKLQ